MSRCVSYYRTSSFTNVGDEKDSLKRQKSVVHRFCDNNGYDWKQVELLGILQYFNICTLYDNFKDGRYGNFLFLYGKYLLAKFLRENNE